MNFMENIISAFSCVFANKMRSILTMLGIIIGISSVIMITSIGDGFETMISGEIDKLGMNIVNLSNDYSEPISEYDKIKLSDIDIIKEVENVKEVIPVTAISAKYKEKVPTETGNLQVTGTTEDYRTAQNVKILYGRFITDQDITARNSVIVIEAQTAIKTFGIDNVVGQKINVEYYFGNVEYEIIGILEGKDYGPMFSGIPQSAIVPITNLMDTIGNNNIDSLQITLVDNTVANDTINVMSKIMDLSHGTSKKYSFQNYMSMIDDQMKIISYVTTFVAFVAFISLIVGGIGVMNIMLVSVTERTREIGIRKSLGATDTNILSQFLIESIILTVIGGFIGIILGYFGGLLIGTLIGLIPKVSIFMIFVAFGASSFIGIVFGVFPAYKAAQLDPIEALRFE